MSARFSPAVQTAPPFEIRARRYSSSPPGLRLPTGGMSGRTGSPRVDRSGRPVPVPALLPVAYRGSYLRRLLAPRRPVERVLLSVIQQAYLAGASTRTLDALAETVGVPGIDPGAVEAQADDWDRRVEAFRRRSLSNLYPYLMLVEIPVLVRESGDAQSHRVVAAVGITESGIRDVIGLAIRPADELVPFWETFFADLKTRGLRGLQLVTSDRSHGLLPSLASVFPGVRWQRCRERFVADVLRTVSRDGRAAVEASLRGVFAEPDTAGALQALARVRGQFEFAYPELVAALQAPIGSLLTFYDVSPADRRRVSSLNALATLQRELRQSFQLVGIFPHRFALLRLAGTILQERSDEWASRPPRRSRPLSEGAVAWAASASVAAA